MSHLHRSRLSKLQAEGDRLTQLATTLERATAQFSATALTTGFNNGAPYHAAQSTRLRTFSGEGSGRTRTEEELLRPYDRVTIISRGRIMIRNNPWVCGIFKAYVQEIGAPTYKSTADLGDEARSTAYNDQRERLLEKWARDCESEADLSLEEVIEIWYYEFIIAGEMFVVFQKTGELQLIASELCGSVAAYGSTATGIGPGQKFQDGTPIPPETIERDGILRLAGRIVGYRFATRDPRTNAVDFSPETSVVIPRAYVRHLYDRDRCEQGRGVPNTATILAKMQDLFETGDARSQQVKNAACLSMWVTKNIDPYGYAESIKGAIRNGNVDNAVTLKTVADARSAHTEMRAGMVYYGAAGETVNLIEPKLAAADWRDHYIDLCQVVCNVLDNMPVEVGLEGFRSSSYSSSRGTMNKWKRNVQRRRRRTVQKLLDPAQLWQTRRAELFGDLPPIPAAQQEECYWGWPAIPDIDGTKTAAMNALELSHGSTTLEIICAEKGLHADQLILQRAREKIAFIDALARGAQKILGLERDKAVAWAMTAAPDSDNPALAAILADAFTADGTPAAPPPAKPVK